MIGSRKVFTVDGLEVRMLSDRPFLFEKKKLSTCFSHFLDIFVAQLLNISCCQGQHSNSS